MKETYKYYPPKFGGCSGELICRQSRKQMIFCNEYRDKVAPRLPFSVTISDRPFADSHRAILYRKGKFGQFVIVQTKLRGEDIDTEMDYLWGNKYLKKATRKAVYYRFNKL
jgi:hypothetical protein